MTGILFIVGLGGISVGVLGMIFSLFMLARNQWVYKVRMKYLDEHSLDEFDRLPSYEQMLNRFWVWDIKKFER